MNILAIVLIGLGAGWWFVDLYRLTGKGTEERLPRPSVRERVRLRKSCRIARREHDFLLRKCVCEPSREDIEIGLAHAQIILVLAEALRKRDAKLAVVASEALKQTRMMMEGMREAQS